MGTEREDREDQDGEEEIMEGNDNRVSEGNGR